MARQVDEISRRLAGLEGRVAGAHQRARAVTDPLAVEIGELGTLVRQLAERVAIYEAGLAELAKQRPPRRAGAAVVG